MKVAFYSTNSNCFEGTDYLIKNFPLFKDEFDKLCDCFPQCEFYVVTQLPGSFLLDIKENELLYKSKNVHYKILKIEMPLFEKSSEVANEILAINPDLVIASSFWVRPYDWLPIQDAMIADILRNNGLNVICNSLETCVTTFDKYKTHQFLKKHNINVAKCVYVHHDLFWCERGNKDIRENVYKEYVLGEIQKLSYPVIAKDTVGLSSYGMEVLPTYKSAKAYLLSHKNSSDRIVEEYLKGEHFGCEVYGVFSEEGNCDYEVLFPFLFSVNKYGITSPKNSVKLGPINNEKYKISELKVELCRLAKELKICGVAQVDLVFMKDMWYVIEVNPRLSGMSKMMAVSKNLTVLKMLMQTSLKIKDNVKNNSETLKPTCSFKLPLVSEEKMKEIFELPYVKNIYQLENKAAKQLREMGYCEVIVQNEVSFENLMQNLEDFSKRFPELVVSEVLENTKILLDKIM